MRNDKTNKLPSQSLNNDNYLKVDLSKNSKRKSFLVHRFVELPFVDNAQNY